MSSEKNQPRTSSGTNASDYSVRSGNMLENPNNESPRTSSGEEKEKLKTNRLSPEQAEAGNKQLGQKISEKRSKSFSKLIVKLWEEPAEWERSFTEFRDSLELHEKHSLTLTGTVQDLESEEHEFSWRKIDWSLERSSKEGLGLSGPAILEIAKTSAALEYGLVDQMIDEYKRNYGDYEKIYAFKNNMGENIIHCIASAISVRVENGRSVNDDVWSVYNETIEEAKVWVPDITEQVNVFGKKPREVLGIGENDIQINIFT